MTEPVFLSSNDVRDHHKAALTAHGGLDGEYQNLLESALGSIPFIYQYEMIDLPEVAGYALLAAIYWKRVSEAHAFVKGNKRTAYRCCLDFLHRNGYDAVFETEEVLAWGPKIATKDGGMSLEELTAILTERLVSLVP